MLGLKLIHVIKRAPNQYINKASTRQFTGEGHLIILIPLKPKNYHDANVDEKAGIMRAIGLAVFITMTP